MASLFGENFDKANLAVTFASGISAILLPFLGWAVGWFFKKYEKNYQMSTGHLGRISLNKLEMGSFVVSAPGSWRYFWPWCFPITHPPTLPRVSSLIAAGDDGVFSSIIFTNLIDPNHDTVSWKSVYEAFVYQYVRWQQRYGLRSPTFQKDSDPTIGMALSAAQKKLKLTRKSACSKLYFDPRPKETFSNGHIDENEPPPATTDSERGADEPIPGPILVHGQKLPPMKQLETLEDGTVTYTINHNQPQSNQSWWSDTREVWIHAGHPSIEVSKEELASLSFIIGIPLHAQNAEFLPNARGPYGITLTSEKVAAITTIRLVFGPRARSPEGPKPLAKGSGYSTLFAKHMACGSLPFARCVIGEPVTKVDMQTVMVTDEVKTALEGGGAISNLALDTKNGGEYPREFNYLARLPSSSTVEFYLNCDNAGDVDQGLLLNAYSVVSGRPAQISSWCDAVAGIPFGGLVPLTTRNLRAVVKFTLEGYLKCPDPANPQELDPIFHLIGMAANELECKKLTEIDVFGYIKDCDGPTVATTKDTEDCDPRFLAETLNCFMTLFERFMAIAAVNGKLDDVGVVRDVHTSLQSKLKEAYDAAVARTPPRTTLEVLINGNKGLAEKVAKRSVKVADCVEAAMCILAAWTSLVRLVRWTKGDSKTGAEVNPEALGATADGRESDYYPPLLRELPDVSAWY